MMQGDIITQIEWTVYSKYFGGGMGVTGTSFVDKNGNPKPPIMIQLMRLRIYDGLKIKRIASWKVKSIKN